MATFTIEFYKAVELVGCTVTQVDGRTILTGGNIGLEHYPIYKEEHRPILNGLIYDHFMTREIGQETVDMFRLALRRKMNEIMPYFNELYESTELDFNPLTTIRIETDTTGQVSQDGSTTAESTANTVATSGARTVNSDTPQTVLSGNQDYATNAADVNSQVNNDSTGNQTNVENQSSDSTSNTLTEGYQGVVSDLLMRYRESIINVDMSIINELEKDLFMLVYNNGDSYTKGSLL